MAKLQFTDDLLFRNAPSGMDVETTLWHFSIITYEVDPEALIKHLHPRFTPFCITNQKGQSKALVSVVPFYDMDFRFAGCSWPKFAFGQTNYRAYVIDGDTGEHVVWFFGTCLDTWSVWVPHHIWKLPWYRGHMRFQCSYSDSLSKYTSYRMDTDSSWAPASVTLEDSGEPCKAFVGFGDSESALVVLTHPLKGYFYRRDGRLGSYRVWHDKLLMSEGSCIEAKFPLLDRLGLISIDKQTDTHSVLIQQNADFTIYLPPELSN